MPNINIEQYESSLLDESSKFLIMSQIEYSKKWGISDRTARNYCSSKKIKGAYQDGGCWFIPEDAELLQQLLT